MPPAGWHQSLGNESSRSYTSPAAAGSATSWKPLAACAICALAAVLAVAILSTGRRPAANGVLDDAQYTALS